MQGLKQEEIKDYCNSRLRLAGLVDDIIAESAFEVIYANSNGIPIRLRPCRAHKKQ